MLNETTRHKMKQEDRQVGRQAGRQEGRQAERQAGREGLGTADTSSETIGEKGETSGRRAHHPDTMGNKGRQGLGKADAPSNTGTHEGRKWETRPPKVDTPSKETTGNNGRQGETRHREGRHTSFAFCQCCTGQCLVSCNETRQQLY